MFSFELKCDHVCFVRFTRLQKVDDVFLVLDLQDELHVRIAVIRQGQRFQSVIVLSSLRFLWLFAESKNIDFKS